MKKLLTLLFAIMLAFTFTFEVDAKSKSNQDVPDNPLIIEEEITVDEDGGTFRVGFAKIKFKKGFLGDEDLSITFTVSLYAEDGEVYIEFSPDVDAFLEDVVIKTSGYEGYLYDVALGENIFVTVPKQKLNVEHFSRYCWAT